MAITNMNLFQFVKGLRQFIVCMTVLILSYRALMAMVLSGAEYRAIVLGTAGMFIAGKVTHAVQGLRMNGTNGTN